MTSGCSEIVGCCGKMESPEPDPMSELQLCTGTV